VSQAKIPIRETNSFVRAEARSDATPRLVRGVTVLRLVSRHTSSMETLVEGTYKAYEVVRTLEDGQRVQVGTFQELSEARGLIASLSEYWPGGYSIVPSSKQERSA
jgi:hypothetical protein